MTASTEVVFFYARDPQALSFGDFSLQEHLDICRSAIQRNSPDTKINLITDTQTALGETSDINVIRNKSIDFRSIMFDRARMYLEFLEQRVQQSSRNNIAFLDLDVLTCRNLDGVFSEDFDVGLTVRFPEGLVLNNLGLPANSTISPINGGVIFARPNSRAVAFFREQLSIYQKLHDNSDSLPSTSNLRKNIKKWGGDQLAFMAMLGKQLYDGFPESIRHNDALVRFLPCETYNYTPENTDDIRQSDLEKRYLMHFKGARKHRMQRLADALGLKYKQKSGNYVTATPYLLPPETKKVVNAGDGFILDSSEKLIGQPAAHRVSIRAPLQGEDIERINDSSMLLVTGSNTLRDDFTPMPGFSLDTLEQIKVPVVFLGLGHYGIASATQGMSASSVKLLDALLERFPFFSVRCNRSRDYLVKSAPHLEENIIMTSCPVIYPIDGMQYSFARKQEYQRLVVTLTDRSNLKQQLPLLEGAARRFPARQRVLALHQHYNNKALMSTARKLGYTVFSKSDYRAYLELYRQCDLHIGNRIHAHLKCLSMNIRSFVTPFDLRQQYFAESLEFPVIRSLNDPQLDDYDFSVFTKRREQTQALMNAYTGRVRELLH